MSTRSTISRREPVIALEPFRYHGRNYKEGGYLDRRRCRMPHSKLVRLLRAGVCILAKNVSPEQLAKYGFTYNPESPRIKLNRLPKIESLKVLNDLKMKEFFNEDEDEDEDDESSEPTLKHVGGGWYDIMIEGKPINDAGLRKNKAIAFITNYKEGV